MAIDVEWQDERGQKLSRYTGPPIGLAFPGRASNDSSCLRFIDPYGDTTFNAVQIVVLESELKQLASDNDPTIAAQAKALIEFITQVQERTHRYLKFIGD